MNLKQIPNYENYSLDLNTNEIYSHNKKKYIKPYINKDGYCIIRVYKNSKVKSFMLHRLIYEQHFETIPDKMEIDHIDNNPLNNNIENLRLATHSQNNMNKKTRKDNLSTGHKNIRLRKCNNTYQVQIYKNKKYVYRKTFKTLEEAILNRDIQLKLIHGQFANFG